MPDVRVQKRVEVLPRWNLSRTPTGTRLIPGTPVPWISQDAPLLM